MESFSRNFSKIFFDKYFLEIFLELKNGITNAAIIGHFIERQQNFFFNMIARWNRIKLMEHINQIIAALNAEKKRRCAMKSSFDWDILARTEQRIPEGDWFGWFIMAGRGFGKTRTGAETIKKLALSGEYKRICLLGETYDQVRSIMIEGESGLLNIHTKDQMPKYKPARKELVWPNGAIASCYSAENYQALRGPQFDLAWIDELAKFDNARNVWDQLMFCLRLGNKPRIIITTTPRPTELILELANRKDIYLTRGSTFDNAKNLPKNFIEIIRSQYGSTQLGQQEIEGQIVSCDACALWNYENFAYSNINEIDLTKHEIIIAIDPAITASENSDETGMIVASKFEQKYYIIEDASGIMKPEIWAQKAYNLYKKYNASEIIVETNNGGDILMAMLRNFENAPWKSVKAKESKYKRAVPIATLYEQKKVIHMQIFKALEEQMVKAHMNFKDDRLDALVWALYSLMQKQATAPFRCWS